MLDPVCATLTEALDTLGAAGGPPGGALAAAAARRAALAEAGVRIDESPYLHFLRRFAGEAAVAPELAASA